MTDQKIVWRGDNQIEMSNFIGNEDFWHKNDELLITQGDELLKIQKGETLIKCEDGKLYLPLSKMSSNGEVCSYDS